jgi:transmembrane sensor
VNASNSDRELEEVAAAWLARRDHGMSAEDQRELARWLAADERHARAFANCEKAWRELPKLRQLPAEKLAAFLKPRRRRRRSWPVWTAGLGAAAAVLIFFRSEPAAKEAPEIFGAAYAAGATEARFVLPDGSVADLRRGGEIKIVEGQTGALVVRLARGEVHFTVAKSSADKFVVRAGDAAIRDLGTAFDVQLEPEQVTVLVTEGRVALAPAARSNESRIVAVGEAAKIFTASGVARVEIHAASAAEFGEHVAWRNRRLVFSRTPLADVVAELNRYHRRRLVLADTATGAVLVTGSFESDNLDAFVRLLAEGFGISAEAGPDQTVLRKMN